MEISQSQRIRRKILIEKVFNFLHRPRSKPPSKSTSMVIYIFVEIGKKKGKEEKKEVDFPQIDVKYLLLDFDFNSIDSIGIFPFVFPKNNLNQQTEIITVVVLEAIFLLR